ncbi:ankyrin repeat domain-containing protein [Flavobacterium sp. DG1-102-2]|uniref:ankyrin repeat domain-containing protein n=1 Tax=Flavobacterium sp. DG1-102-2 TaxID=3081663 RepID=UPI0029495C9D|nr:ankyrin repeat domain-containing protein [Flavobacterium sp. DG1-102-2]MDV6168240.1 ankyrin repeat domain-containing protein [Flavobacterium sp. DG1-102-2]
MSNQTELIEAFSRHKIDDARILLNNPENIPQSLDAFRNNQLFDTLTREKAFDIINLFIDKKLIDTDIYDYDRLSGSLFESIFRNLKDDEESVAFVKELMPKLSSINDAVANETLVSLALSSRANPALVSVLIDEGCDVSAVNNAEDTYLHQIAKDQMMPVDLSLAYAKLLIDNGLDVNAGNIVKETPIMTAISRNKKELVQLLMENGAKPNEENKDGETAYCQIVVHQLSAALYNIVREFEKPDFDKKNKNGEAFFIEYLRRSNTASESTVTLLKAMLEDGADLLQTSNYYSKDLNGYDVLAEKPFDLFEIIIKADGTDVNYTDNNGNTLLHKVAAYNVNYDQNAARDTYKKSKALLELGVDANATNNADETAMMIASADNLKSKTVELLLSAKA